MLYICVKFVENIWRYQSYEADTNDGSPDGRMDTKNFGQYNIIIPSPLFVTGRKKTKTPYLVADANYKWE